MNTITLTNAELSVLPIGTRFKIKDDSYKGSVYECVEFPYNKPRREYPKGERWTLHYMENHDDQYWKKCANCAWHWRIGFCSDLPADGPSFCENAAHYGARTDGKRVIFKVVKE